MCILGTAYKTDVIMDFIPDWIKNNPKGEMTIFDPHAAIIQKYDNVKYSIDPDKDFKWVDYLLEKYKDKREIPKLLVLNGGDKFFPRPKETTRFHPVLGEIKFKPRPMCHKKFQDLLCMKLVLNMDIIITFQTPDAIPITVERFVNNFIILPILEEYQLDRNSPYYQNMDTCIRTINYYHKHYSKNPSKEYLNMSTERNEIIAIDEIDKKKFNKTIKKFKSIKKRVSIEM